MKQPRSETSQPVPSQTTFGRIISRLRIVGGAVAKMTDHGITSIGLNGPIAAKIETGRAQKTEWLAGSQGWLDGKSSHIESPDQDRTKFTRFA